MSRCFGQIIAGLVVNALQQSSHHPGVINDPVTLFTETRSPSRSSSGSSVTSSTSSQWALKQRQLYGAMTEEERGLFDELQSEIGELRRLVTANGGIAKSKVHFMLITTR